MTRILLAGLLLASLGRTTGRGGVASDVFTPDAIATLMRKVNDHTLANPYQENDPDWIRATYYTGVMGAWRATQDPAYLEQAKRWGEKHQWRVGAESSGYNKLFCSMTWTELFLLDKDPAKIRPTIEWIASDAPNSPALGKVWYGHAPAPYDRPLYADALYAAPVFAMLHKATGEQLYLDLLHESFWTVTDQIYDAGEDLYYRDPSYMGKHTANGRKIFWSRGNGWVFAGLARLLHYLPEDEPQRDRYLALFRRMAASLAARQHADGLWRANLGDPDDYRMPESSGTAFFTFGLAWGINAGVLDRDTYLPAVVRGWHGLVSCVHPDGMLGWVQPVDAQPRPSLPVTTHEYATGLFLLAGSEMLKLTRAGTITPESAAGNLVPDDSILPPAATEARSLARTDHPLATEINAFLERQGRAAGFQPTGLDRGDYLDVIAGQVKAMRPYQDADGRIIDPVTRREMYFATPCYAHGVAALATGNHPAADDLLESGARALDISIRSLAENRPAGKHGDFYTWPVMFAYEMFLPFAAEERKETWRRGLAGIDITKAYNAYRRPYGAHEHQQFYKEYGKEWANNWNMVHAAGEFLRARHGFTDLAYTDFCLAMQLPHFTPCGMYDESGSPPAYDLFARHYATGMLHRGYRSFAYSTYRDLMWKGAWTSLFLQSPFGELPTGYRSSHHIWNEAEQAVVFEIYANHHARAGRTAEAGAFKRAAHLALQSVKSWIRPDGTGCIVKNRYPIEARHGYETYSEHTPYNLLACSMLAQAWQFADERVPEKPSPADLGGFVVAPPAFHKVFANASGHYVEYETRGDQTYNPTGLLRVHVRDGHPQLGPSDGCAPLFSGENVLLSVGPVWIDRDGNPRRLAASRDPPRVEILEQSPSRAAFRVTYPQVVQTLTVDRDGVTVEDVVTDAGARAVRVTFPMLVSDGETMTEVDMEGNVVTLRLAGKGIRFTVVEPVGVRLQRSGEQVRHRNGMVEAAVGETPGKRIVYRITAGGG